MKKELDVFQIEELRLAKEDHIDLSFYAEKNFDWTQLEEIRLGLLHNIEVFLYAKECYVSFQMRQIRLGLENKINTSIYLNPKYDWYQMEEIRLGLEAKLDVSIYANKDYDYMSMREIRRGLIAGVNLAPYIERGYRNSVLKQIWKAKEDNVNIERYVVEGYDSEQLEEIRVALKKKIDIFPYVNINTFGSQMKEIRLGLEHGVDVTVYKASDYNWQQMREIRLGLEKKLEIFWYNSPLYTSRQMKEIRLGLEEDFDVVYYATYLFSALDMKRSREWMKQNNTSQPFEEPIDAPEENTIDKVRLEKINVEIEHTGMHAYMQVPEPKEDEVYSVEYFVSVLNEYGVCQGILKDELKKIVEEKKYFERIEVARGKESVAGTDGRYEFFFRTEMPIVPKLLEDGSVDYKNIDFFEVVKEGQKIAVYHPSTVGVYGYKVTGLLSAPKKGMELPKLRGKGYTYDVETHAYYASMEGRIETKGYEVNITPFYVFRGDVTASVGNIRFHGDIEIKGYVGSGVTIEAGGDLVVNGNVEAAVLKAGKNILIKSGVCAKDMGLIEAGDSISGKYFESVKLVAKNDIRANYLLNCDSTAMGKVIVAGKKGAIAGGVTHATYGITSYSIGNVAELRTVLDIGMNDIFTQKFSDLDEDANRIKSEIKIFQNSMEKFEKTHSKDELEGLTVYEKIQQAMMVKQEEFDQVRKTQTDMVRRIQNSRQYIQVRVMGTAYPGCIVKIDRTALKVSEQAFSVLFKRDDNRVAVFSGRA